MTDEYLDRSSLVARMKYYEEHTTEGSGEHYAYSTALREIRNAPAADVAPVVHEKWLLDRWQSWPHRECSRCKIMIPRTKEVPDQYWQYCPNCGARMDGGKDDEAD